MEIQAYAKINLTLEVLFERPDGYHELKTVIQTIDLADRLHFEPNASLEVTCSEPDLQGEDNLVWKAAEALRNVTGCDSGANILLEKHIPISMGLGGGSSDAAAALTALNRLWGLDMDAAQLRSIASTVGSDVPFFIEGGTALCEGRGEIVSPLPPCPQTWLVLLCPHLPPDQVDAHLTPKTAWMYSIITKDHYTYGSRSRGLAGALKESELNEELLFNVFEQVAPSAFPGLGDAIKHLQEAGARRVHLSGSGPALYGLVSSQEEGEAILKSLKSIGSRAYLISTLQPDASLARDWNRDC